jgi:hypothetical protein
VRSITSTTIPTAGAVDAKVSVPQPTEKSTKIGRIERRAKMTKIRRIKMLGIDSSARSNWFDFALDVVRMDRKDGEILRREMLLFLLFRLGIGV